MTDPYIETVRTLDMRTKSTGCAQCIVERRDELIIVAATDVRPSDSVLETMRP